MSSYVIEFPIHIDGIRTVNEVSMWEQLQLATFLQKYWADNQVSSTITFKAHEKDQIKYALNYFQYSLKGISFLPKIDCDVYEQMPYEQITKEKYEQKIKSIKKLQFKEVNEDSIPELYCDGDTCTLK
jgi:hypothetical protein